MAMLVAPQAIAVVYPEKPIRMIVAVPPAGPADTLSRLISPKLASPSVKPSLSKTARAPNGISLTK